METFTRGSGSRVGSMLVDEKKIFFLVEKAWMDEFTLHGLNVTKPTYQMKF